ncbi:MAG: hypothetical protein A2Y62_11710 [Candidatus Fischerbacteria bacterium RBG_13_37_8]|uniref:Aminopeptidase n=1 Tax=Candidatus Fischerbacteria bacterium RBG_13_37_8 TaxID=1817863 RepID=A0A1F5VGI7_9BACT|nr:MAG: hypothetical protein A2Y62_11710 [Candidatus Fischerbacteria bacterium RBG_13_37_8]
MNAIDKAILNALKVNMGYKESESIAIIMQEWHDALGEQFKPGFDRSKELCMRMYEVFQHKGYNVELFSYYPLEARNGVDASHALYEKIGTYDIIFMPTAFSLTHTTFRKTQTAKGARIASMPGFMLEMFEEDGPMSIDYNKLLKDTEQVAERLKAGNMVRITAHETDMLIEPDTELVRVSAGVLTKTGQWGNLPGAEAYVVPVHDGISRGYFTVPAGWGGSTPLKFSARFIIENARFIDVIGENNEAQEYINAQVKPLIFGQENFDVLAEFGIGTNPHVTAEYVAKKGWSTLTAEKIYGSVHFANGNSFGIGGKNDVQVHIDWVVPDAVWVC